MVCPDCEKKLGRVIVQDKWKDGARNTMESGGKKVGSTSMMARSQAQRFSPYQSKCKFCKQKVHQEHSTICHTCAYKQGLCSMCGKKILDVSSFKQSSR